MMRHLSYFLVVVVVTCLCHSQLLAQDRERVVTEEWPGVSGWSTTFMRYDSAEKRHYVDLIGLVNHQIAMNPTFPKLVVLTVDIEQARAVSNFYKEMEDRSRPFEQADYDAEVSGDPVAINAAKRAKAEAAMVDSETLDFRFKNLVIDVMNQDQLDDIHALCVNVAMERIGLGEVMNRYSQRLVESGMSTKDLGKIRQAIAKAEMEMQRELVELRRKAWQSVMKELPPHVVRQIEKDLGFDGLDKPSN